MLVTSAFLKQNSAISLEESVLVFILFTTATRKLRVNVSSGEGKAEERGGGGEGGGRKGGRVQHALLLLQGLREDGKTGMSDALAGRGEKGGLGEGGGGGGYNTCCNTGHTKSHCQLPPSPPPPSRCVLH